MRRTKSRSRDKGARVRGSRSDLLTRLLSGVALLLVAAAAAVAVDLFVWPEPEEPLTQAVDLVPSPSLATSQGTPTAQPPGATASVPTAITPPPCVAPSDWGVHIVERGDTLYSLAQKYGSDVESLMQVNCLDGPTILIDQRLYVPGPLALPTFATPESSAVAELPAADTPTPEPSATPLPELPEVTTITVPTSGPENQVWPALDVDIPDRYLHVALLGTDKRHKGPTRPTWRTDAIIIASVDLEDNTVRLLHVPRDLWVFIPGYGENRINTAVLWGEFDEEGTGPEWVKRTIYHNLGIPIHYFVKMDWAGFINVVDAVGGVDIDVACPLPEIDLEPGMHHLDGEMALYFVQRRTTSSDYDRGRRQRKMLTALWDQILTPEIIPKIPKLWVELAGSFETDLPLDQVLNLAYLGLRLEPQDIRTAAISGQHTTSWITPEGAMVLRPKEEAIRTLLQDFYAALEMANVDPASKVHIQMVNGWTRPDADRLAAAALRREGFKVKVKDRVGPSNLAETKIVVYRGELADGKRVARELGIPRAAVVDETNIPDPPNPSNPVDIKVILGADYNPCQR